MNRTLQEFKAEIFSGLAHPTRIAIIDALREGEMTAGSLIERLGLEQANASQHLAVLRAKRIVNNRKAGNQVYYSLRDPVILELLDVLRRYYFSHVAQTVAIFEKVGEEEGVHRP
ncbi:MAG: ArsR/SmtB family transcription factor [Bryobacteraceae bacterium]